MGMVIIVLCILVNVYILKRSKTVSAAKIKISLLKCSRNFYGFINYALRATVAADNKKFQTAE